jgi:hypothetical protein
MEEHFYKMQKHIFFSDFNSVKIYNRKTIAKFLEKDDDSIYKKKCMLKS